MAAQQCRESERLHGIICCYIGFAFFSPCKFQTGNPSRRCALQGSLWTGIAACCHAFLARSPDKFGLSRCFPKSGTAEDAIQLSREEVYLLSITIDSVEVWEWEGQKIKILLLKWVRRVMDSFFGGRTWNVKEFWAFRSGAGRSRKLREKESIRRKHNNIAVKQEDTKV